ncbi:hypothetical protein KUH32_13715 [Thalassococcus sp. CAU 1522]|uniref:Uncharacterized protein n=1 Tax=Thalassococcus arenae TaxID=2851652 RepID=A0ABS6NB61_9RHOB|nr:hypothetical protein [Thalassococcus arenae]MBV2360819.1 hypothetical protein [Thalassococcus arenae]
MTLRQDFRIVSRKMRDTAIDPPKTRYLAAFADRFRSKSRIFVAATETAMGAFFTPQFGICRKPADAGFVCRCEPIARQPAD